MIVKQPARVRATVALDSYYEIPTQADIKQYLIDEFGTKLKLRFEDYGWVIKDIKIGEVDYKVYTAGVGAPAIYAIKSFDVEFIMEPTENAVPIEIESGKYIPGQMKTSGFVISFVVIVGMIIAAMITFRWAIINPVVEILNRIANDPNAGKGLKDFFKEMVEIFAPVLIAILVALFVLSGRGEKT